MIDRKHERADKFNRKKKFKRKVETTTTPTRKMRRTHIKEQ